MNDPTPQPSAPVDSADKELPLRDDSLDGDLNEDWMLDHG